MEPTAHEPSFPPPPRPVGPGARRRAWSERGPRTWVLAAGLMLAVAGALAGFRLAEWNTANRVQTRGTPVDAQIVEIDATARPGLTMARNSVRHVTLAYALPGSPTVYRERGLPTPGQETVAVGQTLKVRVDPSAPTRWREQLPPPSLRWALAFPAVAAGLAALFAVGAAVARRGVLALWRAGELVPARIASVGTTPLAPRSHALKVSVAGEDRLLDVLWPRGLGEVDVDDEIDVVVNEGRRKALPAAAYV